MKTVKVLVPVDGSEFSLQILPQITQVLDPTRTELILLNVAPEPTVIEVGAPDNPETTIYVDQQEAGLQMDFEAAMSPKTREMKSAGFRVSTAMRFGAPASQIDQFIEDHDIGMVAMTTHGRTGLPRAVFGSVAEHVLHHVRVPVLLYRSLEHAQAGQ
jgi:nucleotide-binding universal stress UspA family protein